MNLREIKLKEALGRFAVQNADHLQAEVIVKVKRFLGLLPSQPPLNSVHWLYLMVLQLPSQTYHLFSLRLPPVPPCTIHRFQQGTWQSGSSRRLFPDRCYSFRRGYLNPFRLVTEVEVFGCPGNEVPGISEVCSESAPLLKSYSHEGEKQGEIHCFNLWAKAYKGNCEEATKKV